MRRDMNLIRIILEAAEGIPHNSKLINPEFEGYTRDQIYYHVGLASARELITAQFTLGPAMHIAGLTWAGHDFLDDLRNGKVSATSGGSTVGNG